MTDKPKDSIQGDDFSQCKPPMRHIPGVRVELLRKAATSEMPMEQDPQKPVLQMHSMPQDMAKVLEENLWDLYARDNTQAHESCVSTSKKPVAWRVGHSGEYHLFKTYKEAADEKFEYESYNGESCGEIEPLYTSPTPQDVGSEKCGCPSEGFCGSGSRCQDAPTITQLLTAIHNYGLTAVMTSNGVVLKNLNKVVAHDIPNETTVAAMQEARKMIDAKKHRINIKYTFKI